MTRIVFHPGSPKTATSTLQHVLAQNRAALGRRGIGVILPQDIRGNPYLGKYLAVYRGKSLPDMRQATEAFFRPWRKYQLVICSEETFCHDFMPSRKFGLGGIDRAEVAAELLSMSGFDQTEIVLTIRPQRDLLISTYSHFIHRHREFRRFPEWLQQEVDLERLFWMPAVGAFRDRFGEGAVRVVSMMTADKPPAGEGGMAAYLSAILAAMRIDVKGLNLAADQVHNPSPSRRAATLCRVINQRVPELDLAEKVNGFLISTFPVAEYGKLLPRLTLPPGMIRRFIKDHAEALS